MNKSSSVYQHALNSACSYVCAQMLTHTMQVGLNDINTVTKICEEVTSCVNHTQHKRLIYLSVCLYVSIFENITIYIFPYISAIIYI